MIFALTAFQTLVIATGISSAVFGWFAWKDVKVWLDQKPETETASTVIRHWMNASLVNFAAVCTPIVFGAALIVWLAGHFPLGLW
jgi:hypothetical protein